MKALIKSNQNKKLWILNNKLFKKSPIYNGIFLNKE